MLDQNSILERELLERMAGNPSPFVIIRFQEDDWMVIQESPSIVDHSVGFLQLECGSVVPCMYFQSSKYQHLTTEGIVDAKDCSDELSYFVNLADLYLGTQHGYQIN